VDGVGDVAVEESAADGHVEGGPDDHVDLVHALGRQASAVLAAGGGQGLVERLGVIWSEAPQRDVSDGRVDVAVDDQAYR